MAGFILLLILMAMGLVMYGLGKLFKWMIKKG